MGQVPPLGGFTYKAVAHTAQKSKSSLWQVALHKSDIGRANQNFISIAAPLLALPPSPLWLKNSRDFRDTLQHQRTFKISFLPLPQHRSTGGFDTGL